MQIPSRLNVNFKDHAVKAKQIAHAVKEVSAASGEREFNTALLLEKILPILTDNPIVLKLTPQIGALAKRFDQLEKTKSSKDTAAREFIELLKAEIPPLVGKEAKPQEAKAEPSVSLFPLGLGKAIAKGLGLMARAEEALPPKEIIVDNRAVELFNNTIARFIHLARLYDRMSGAAGFIGIGPQYHQYREELIAECTQYWLLSWDVKDRLGALPYPERDKLTNEEIERNQPFFEAWQELLDEDEKVRVNINTGNLCRKLSASSERVMLNKPIILPDFRGRRLFFGHEGETLFCANGVSSADHETVVVACIANAQYSGFDQSFGFAKIERTDPDGQKYYVLVDTIMMDNQVYDEVLRQGLGEILDLLSDAADYSIHDIAHGTVSPAQFFHPEATITDDKSPAHFVDWEDAITAHQKYEGRYINQVRAAANKRAFAKNPERRQEALGKVERFYDLVLQLQTVIDRRNSDLSQQLGDYLSMMMHRHVCELFEVDSPEMAAIKAKVDKLCITPIRPTALDVAELLLKRGLLDCGVRRNLDTLIELSSHINLTSFASALGIRDRISPAQFTERLQKLRAEGDTLSPETAETIKTIFYSVLGNRGIRQIAPLVKLRYEAFRNLDPTAIPAPENMIYARDALTNLGIISATDSIPNLNGFEAIRFRTMQVTQMGEKVFAFAPIPFGNQHLTNAQITELFAISLNDVKCKDTRYSEDDAPVITGVKGKKLDYGQVYAQLRVRAEEGHVVARAKERAREREEMAAMLD